MIDIILERIWKTDKSIIGLISNLDDVDGFRNLFALENPWKDNKRCISCIPSGRYICKREKSTKNGKWGEAFYIQKVPGGRSRIIFGHIGNRPDQTLGCILFGEFYTKENYVGRSTQAIDYWMSYMRDINEFKLEIVEYF